MTGHHTALSSWRHFDARKTQDSLRLEGLLKPLVTSLSSAQRVILPFWWTPQERAAFPEDKKLRLVQEIRTEAQPVLQALEFHFENPRDEARAKPFLNRLRNFKKLVVQCANVHSWDDVTAFVTEHATKARSATQKFSDYADLVVQFVDYMDSEIEAQFSYGGYGVVLVTSHHGDWSDDLVGRLKWLIDASNRVLSRVGFGGLTGGRLFAYPSSRLPGSVGSMRGALAMYHTGKDTMWVAAAASDNSELLNTMVHELGHRVFYKGLHGGARNAWADFFDEESGPPDIDRIIADWEDYATKGEGRYAVNRGRYYAYYREVLEKHDPTAVMWVDMIFRALKLDEKLDNYRGAPTKNSVAGLDAIQARRSEIKVFLHPVTAYSAKNADELFAETFAYYALEGASRIPPVVRQVFRTVLPRFKGGSGRSIDSSFMSGQ